jgi:hypothetical protein
MEPKVELRLGTLSRLHAAVLVIRMSFFPATNLRH